MKEKLLYITILLTALTSCQFHDVKWVEFDKVETSKKAIFTPTRIEHTSLGDGIPENCYLPGGEPATEENMRQLENGIADEAAGGPQRASGTTMSWILQNIFDYNNQRKLVQIAGTYPSVDENGDPIIISGKVVMPADGKFSRYILVSHYTIGSNFEAPSNAFSLEAVLAGRGYALVIPDYIGYGVTADRVHPYLCMDVTAQNVLDMLLCVRRYMSAQNIKPDHEEVLLMGYSQGGATTMAVERLIETYYQNEYDRLNDPDDYVGIHRVFAGGGPYDVQATYENFITNNYVGYPVAMPLVIQGMILGNHLKLDGRDMTLADVLQPRMCDKIDEWINSKRYTTAQINGFIGTKISDEILNETGMNPSSYVVSELYKAMTANSIASYNWTPKASVYMFHSMDDDTVNYLNASSAKSRWKDADITYNFGHYGNHVMGCLRFIFSVRTLLEEELNDRNNTI